MKSRTVLVVALALGALSCSREAEPVQEPASHAAHEIAEERGVAVKGMVEVEVPYERRQLIGVRTVAIGTRPLVRSIRTVGIVSADERRVRKIQTRVSGWVQHLFVNFTGAFVEAGAPILSMYSPELISGQREYLLASRRGTGVEAVQRELADSARSRLLFFGLSEKQITDLERSRTPEQTVSLHSPIAGFVTLKPVYEGMYVTPEMELYTVTDLVAVWVWADVYEDEISLVSPGQAATVTLAAAPGVSRPAVVSYVNPTLETATRTLRVRLDVENADGQLKPGMYATVELAAPLGEVLALPEDAVIDTGERRVVFVEVGDGRFQPREVSLGRKAEGHYEVLSGLTVGDRVVVSAQFLLDSESRLRAAAGGPSHAGH